MFLDCDVCHLHDEHGIEACMLFVPISDVMLCSISSSRRASGEACNHCRRVCEVFRRLGRFPKQNICIFVLENGLWETTFSPREHGVCIGAANQSLCPTGIGDYRIMLTRGLISVF